MIFFKLRGVPDKREYFASYLLHFGFFKEEKNGKWPEYIPWYLICTQFFVNSWLPDRLCKDCKDYIRSKILLNIIFFIRKDFAKAVDHQICTKFPYINQNGLYKREHQSKQKFWDWVTTTKVNIDTILMIGRPPACMNDMNHTKKSRLTASWNFAIIV